MQNPHRRVSQDYAGPLEGGLHFLGSTRNSSTQQLTPSAVSQRRGSTGEWVPLSGPWVLDSRVRSTSARAAWRKHSVLASWSSAKTARTTVATESLCKRT
jgi:hypothetical protein